ncbi:hypothetical protein ID866_3115 [Astraeus odoratus]|nr:hypothetical protein ID866_3115 [Astraeus odoratus]
MGIIQDPEVEKGGLRALPNNPFFPPPDGSCPINQLPPEILSLVFEHGVALDHDDDNEEDEEEDEDSDSVRSWDKSRGGETESESEDGSSGSEESGLDSDDASINSSEFWPPFQLLASHICRHWRNVALETPSLWNKIYISDDDSPPFDRVTTYLQRSKSLPLDITIGWEPSDYVEQLVELPEDVDFEALLALLVPHIPKWRYLRVDVTSYEHMFIFLKTVADPSIPAASQLEELELHHYEDSESLIFLRPDLAHHITIFNGSTPPLKSVDLWGVHVDWNQSWLRSANLLALQLAYHTEDVRPSWAAFSTMLRRSPALEMLYLISSGPSGPPSEWIIEPGAVEWDADTSSPILLQSLTELVLAFNPPSYVAELLRRLCMPGLKRLTLDFADDDYTDLVLQLVGPATSVLTPFGGRPRSLLRTIEDLKIAGLPCDNRSVDRLYDQLVNLKTLNLSMIYLALPFFDRLFPHQTPSGSSSVVLPALTSLSVSGVAGERLRELVTARKDAGVPLRTVYVEQDSEIEDVDLAWLRDNVEIFEFFEGSDDEYVSDVGDEIDIAEGEDDEWSDVSN